MSEKRILIGGSGASGLPILVKTLELIRKESTFRSALILTKSAELTLKCETDLSVEELKALADESYAVDDIGAGPASGTFDAVGMIVVPCSMKTLAGIHSGYADNLLLRAADVTVKEKRPLVLCVRESPLSPIHLRNMQELAMLSDVHIVPPMLTFYGRPKTVDDLVFCAAARLLRPFGIRPEGSIRWDGTGSCILS